MDQTIRDALRNLPAVHELQNDPRLEAYSAMPKALLRSILREQMDITRKHIRCGQTKDASDLIDHVIMAILDLVEPRRDIVVNGTGVIVHTNLGRAPVSRATAQSMAEHAGRYQALELELSTGERGGRGDEVSRLMRTLTGAEQTLVVNNNAAAVLLTLAATTSGREVIVSRGEAVEIGGGFRVPDVLVQSGASLVEVGTTNRTYLRDYEQATTVNTAAYLKVHASNFEISGFTASTSLPELSVLAADRNVLLIEDVGSGCLLDTRQFGLQYEPTLGESIASGADVVCASGDKLLGGPQAGLILGKADVVDRIARHPLARALRADKSCLAGLAATLRHYVRGEATDSIPVWWAIACEPEWLEQRVKRWAEAANSNWTDVIQTRSVVGGGSLPGRTLPSYALVIDLPGVPADEIARRLRTGDPGLMPRIVDDRVAIDARSVLQDEDELVIQAVRQVAG